MKKMLPPTYLFICLVIAVALHFLIPIKQFIHYPFNLIGFLFFLIGGVLNIWTDQLFKKSKTTVKPNEKPTTFIQSGPFSISRNPMYLGIALLLVGVSFILGSVISFIGFILFIVLMEVIFIKEEEKNLQAQFGKEYEVYKQKVRRWI